ncbi:hypothetical protein E4K10_42130 [Streptomyces sp. T1317-0309]|nr:hypothetical protein E4K10_42130 [Streptomyces sp. T1317-0309]
MPELLLADSPEASDRIVRRVFGPLERAEAVDLAHTLRCLAAHDFDNTTTAAELPVHRNTLLYRVARIEKRLDCHSKISGTVPSCCSPSPGRPSPQTYGRPRSGRTPWDRSAERTSSCGEGQLIT